MKLFRKIETTAENGYKVRDVISFNLNDGEEVEDLAVKQDDDGMIFYFVDALKKEYCMSRTSTNRGGYESCELRNNLNGEILDRFPAEIREKMVAFVNGDFLRLATEREIFGKNIFVEQENDTVQQWEPMRDRRNRICFQGNKTGAWEWCWLQNESTESSTLFSGVSVHGTRSDRAASDSFGVRPAFKITI